MDDKLRGQPVALGDLRIAGSASSEFAARFEQLQPGGVVNRSVNAPAAQQRRVRRIHDGIDRQRRNISVYGSNQNWRLHGFAVFILPDNNS
ncbi:hypothetical protein NY406_10340 [Chlorobaculum sp. MV4-Y]|nr:hypothetical protein [Chlorobaculum sp. MV4-Y]UWX58803.1 hypothetical protein NY406_10340 [Chlorobaculum sp. MV4-Y]